MPERPSVHSFPNVEHYLGDRYNFRPLVWDRELAFPPGTIVRLQDSGVKRIYIFESLQPKEHMRQAEGLLSIIKDGQIVLEREPFAIEGRLPTDAMGISTTRYIEFRQGHQVLKTDEDEQEVTPETNKGPYVRLFPAFTIAEATFLEEIASYGRYITATERLFLPFQSPTSIQTLTDILDYLQTLSWWSRTRENMNRYEDTADVIKELLEGIKDSSVPRSVFDDEPDNNTEQQT